MGVERAVTRWYVQRQAILNDIERITAQLEQPLVGQAEDLMEEEKRKADLAQQLKKAQERLHLLGPCPKPMMG